MRSFRNCRQCPGSSNSFQVSARKPLLDASRLVIQARHRCSSKAQPVTVRSLRQTLLMLSVGSKEVAVGREGGLMKRTRSTLISTHSRKGCSGSWKVLYEVVRTGMIVSEAVLKCRRCEEAR